MSVQHVVQYVYRFLCKMQARRTHHVHCRVNMNRRGICYGGTHNFILYILSICIFVFLLQLIHSLGYVANQPARPTKHDGCIAIGALVALEISH